MCIRDSIKVDGFLNHRIDTKLLNSMGKEFYRLFGDLGVTKILTAEASGIAVAVIAAQYFDVPVVFAKKAKSDNIEGGLYASEIYSYTYNLSLIPIYDPIGPLMVWFRNAVPWLYWALAIIAGLAFL